MNYELAEQLKEGRKANVLPRAAMSSERAGLPGQWAAEQSPVGHPPHRREVFNYNDFDPDGP
jgi:hypothetical protein